MDRGRPAGHCFNFMRTAWESFLVATWRRRFTQVLRSAWVLPIMWVAAVDRLLSIAMINQRFWTRLMPCREGITVGSAAPQRGRSGMDRDSVKHLVPGLFVRVLTMGAGSFVPAASSSQLPHRVGPHETLASFWVSSFFSARGYLCTMYIGRYISSQVSSSPQSETTIHLWPFNDTLAGRFYRAVLGVVGRIWEHVIHAVCAPRRNDTQTSVCIVQA